MHFIVQCIISIPIHVNDFRSNNSSTDLHSSSASVSSCPPSPNLSAKLSRSVGGSEGAVWSRLTGSANTTSDSRYE